MIFLDTSAVYALADRDDARHAEAVERAKKLSEQGETLFTQSYVLVESLALLQRRLGAAAASAFATDARTFTVVWVDKPLHEEAVRRIGRSGRRVSFVDEVSFLVMRRHGVHDAFAFDPDFEAEGFRLIGG